jgi:hypothetical protein
VIGIFGFLPTFLDGLGNWKTDRIRPFRHRLPDRIPVLSHFDAHFFFFLISQIHMKQQSNNNKQQHTLPMRTGRCRRTDWQNLGRTVCVLVPRSFPLSTKAPPLLLLASSSLTRPKRPPKAFTYCGETCSLWHSPVV